MKNPFKWIKVLVFIFSLVFVYSLVQKSIKENALLREIISRLEADSRVAQVLVTNVRFDEQTQKTSTTIKFLEFDSNGSPLEPKYFIFSGNIIQFQALVI